MNIINMKQLTFTIILLLSVLSVSAQDDGQESLSIQSVIDACVAMRDAVASKDTDAIRQSAAELKKLNTSDFNTLRNMDGSDASLKGHLVFSEEFADSLAEGKDAYGKADDINRERSERGQTADGSILTKTCFVKAKKSVRYIFPAKGPQELAVVAEAGGLVTMKIHVTNDQGLDKRYDDIKDVKKGRPQRKTSFVLPKNLMNTVELVIINRGKKDSSFVVISN